MEMRLALSLPRDRSTVPLTRRILDAALAVLGITGDCRDDISLAIGEACANAVEHAQQGNAYEVTVTINEDRCVIDVIDGGSGIDPTAVPEEVSSEDEAGRGLRIIRALADAVEVRRRQPRGASLRIVKLLTRTVQAIG
jgi:serine/threonine-protein kinase RsbW